MKRFGKLILLLMLFVLAGEGTVWGAGQVTMFVQSRGEDRYGNGDFAEIGALYAVVWVKDGATFHFQADGSWDVVDGCQLLGIVRTKHAKCCADAWPGFETYQAPYQIQFTSDQMNGFKSGRFELHLLDTRNLDMTPSAVAGDDVRPSPTLINVSTTVASATLADVKAGESDVFKMMTTPVYDISLVPEETPQPLITSCRLVTEGDAKYFELKVKRTVRYLNYNVARSDEFPVTDRTNNLAQAINGSPTSNPEEERTIRVPLAGNEKCGFFRVIRHQPIPVEKAGVTP